MKNLFQRHRELIVYIIVGLSTTVLDLVFTVIYSNIFGNEGIHVTINTTIAWLLATAYAFFMNKLVVFRSKSLDAKTLLVEGGEFFGIRLFSWGFETLGMNLLCIVLGFNDLTFSFTVTNGAATVFCLPIAGFTFSKLCMLIITTITNYIFSKFIVFRKHS